MKPRLLILTAFLLTACATTQQQQEINTAIGLAQTAVHLSTVTGKVSPSQADAIAAFLALAQQNPIAANIASNNLYGAASVAQAGQPVASGADIPALGTAIAQVAPAGTPDAKAALLQAAAALVAKK